jgi:hypothetical protein
MPIYRAAPLWGDNAPDPKDEFDQAAVGLEDAKHLIQTAIIAGWPNLKTGSVSIGEVLDGGEIDWRGALDWDEDGWRWEAAE